MHVVWVRAIDVEERKRLKCTLTQAHALADTCTHTHTHTLSHTCANTYTYNLHAAWGMLTFGYLINSDLQTSVLCQFLADGGLL